jgi:rhamnulokinase
VVIADLVDGVPQLTEVARFANGPVLAAGRWVWDIDELRASTLAGLALAAEQGAKSWGIDTWALDFGVLDEHGVLAGPIVAYRDGRHAGGVPIVRAVLPWERHYGITGMQHMDFNTVYQLAAEQPSPIRAGSTFMLVPDLISYWLTGVRACDVTNASTTAMVDVHTRQWSPEIISALGLPPSAFLPPDEPGAIRGESSDPRLRGMPLVGVATHDTASAFVGTPLTDRQQALILSLGTWALIGCEVTGAVPTGAARDLNITHELGAECTVRLLRNVSGMWLLDECRRAWALQDGQPTVLEDLLDAAERALPFAAGFDVDDPGLAAPGQSEISISGRLIGRWDGSRGGVVRTLLESLVVKIARRAAEIEGLTGGHRPTLHVVGGGSRIRLLMQWLADATGKVVIAGPVEATALGNAIVQWQAMGTVSSLAEARSMLGDMPEITRYEPRGSKRAWDDFAERITAGKGSTHGR